MADFVRNIGSEIKRNEFVLDIAKGSVEVASSTGLEFIGTPAALLVSNGAAAIGLGVFLNDVVGKTLGLQDQSLETLLSKTLRDADRSAIDKFKQEYGVNPSQAVSQFVSQHASALLKDENFVNQPAGAKDIVQQKMIETLFRATAENKIESLLAKESIGNIGASVDTVVKTTAVLTEHRRLTEKRLKKIDDATSEVLAEIKKTRLSVEATGEALYDSLPNDAKARLLESSDVRRDKFTAEERFKEIQRLKLESAKEKMVSEINKVSSDAQSVLGLASKLNILPKEVIKEASKGINFVASGLNLGMAIASGNIMGAIGALSSMLGVEDPADVRHRETMEQFGKVNEKLDKIDHKLDDMKREILAAIYEIKVEIRALSRKLDQYYGVLLKEEQRTQTYALASLRGIDAVLNQSEPHCLLILDSLKALELQNLSYEDFYYEFLVNINNSSDSGGSWSDCERYLTERFFTLPASGFYEGLIVNFADLDPQSARSAKHVQDIVQQDNKLFTQAVNFAKRYVGANEIPASELVATLQSFVVPSPNLRVLSKKLGELRTRKYTEEEFVLGGNEVVKAGKSTIFEKRMTLSQLLTQKLHGFKVLRDARYVTDLQHLYELRLVKGQGFSDSLETLVNQGGSITKGKKLIENAIVYLNALLIQHGFLDGDTLLPWLYNAVFFEGPADQLKPHQKALYDEAIGLLKANPNLATNFAIYTVGRGILRNLGATEDKTYASFWTLISSPTALFSIKNYLGLSRVNHFEVLSRDEKKYFVFHSTTPTPTHNPSMRSTDTANAKAENFEIELPPEENISSGSLIVNPVSKAALVLRNRLATLLLDYQTNDRLSLESREEIRQLIVAGLKNAK